MSRKRTKRQEKRERERCVHFCNAALSRIALLFVRVHYTYADAACTCKHVHTSYRGRRALVHRAECKVRQQRDRARPTCNIRFRVYVILHLSIFRDAPKFTGDKEERERISIRRALSTIHYFCTQESFLSRDCSREIYKREDVDMLNISPTPTFHYFCTRFLSLDI